MAQPKVIKDLKTIKDDMGSKANLNTTDKTNFVAAINEAFQFANNGKEGIASVIGSPATAGNTFPQLKTHIQNAKNKLATNLSNVGQASVGTETLDALAAKVANAQSGVTGEVLTSGIFRETIAKGDPVSLKNSIEHTSIIDVLPTSGVHGAAFSPDGNYLGLALNSTPFMALYKYNGSIFTKLPNPTVMPTYQSLSAVFSPDGLHFAIGGQYGQNILVYKRSGDTFTLLTDLGTRPWKMDYSSDGVYLVCAYGQNVEIWKRNGDTYTKITGISTSGHGSTITAVKFSPDTNYLAIGFGNGSAVAGVNLVIFKRSGDTFTKLAIPSVTPPNNINDIEFSPDSLQMAVAHSNGAYIYKNINDNFVKLSALTGEINLVSGCTYSKDGKTLYLSVSTSIMMRRYNVSGETYTLLPAPAYNPSAPSVAGVKVTDNGRFALFHAGSGFDGTQFLALYKLSEGIYKSSLLASEGSSGQLGYAKESGTAGQTKQIALIWR